MYCEKCGRQIPEGSAFCSECGKKVQEEPQDKAQEGVFSTFSQPQKQFFSEEPVAPGYQQPQDPYDGRASYNYYQELPPQGYPQVMGTGEYVGVLLLSAIPIIGFIMLLIWAFGGNVNPNKRNFSRALLIITLISVVLAVVLTILLLIIGALAMNSASYYF